MNVRTHYIEPKRYRGVAPINREVIEAARAMELAGKQRQEIMKLLGVHRVTLWKYLGKKPHWNRRPPQK